jgi:Uma2 family endonuclease
MTVATRSRMSLEEYLTYEDGTDARYEWVDGVLVEMGAESTGEPGTENYRGIGSVHRMLHCGQRCDWGQMTIR